MRTISNRYISALTLTQPVSAEVFCLKLLSFFNGDGVGSGQRSEQEVAMQMQLPAVKCSILHISKRKLLLLASVFICLCKAEEVEGGGWYREVKQ